MAGDMNTELGRADARADACGEAASGCPRGAGHKRLAASMSDDFYQALLRERFGPVPTAELHRPLPEECGDGGPDTPERVAARIRVLNGTNEEENE
jgi:hypothetical protein